MTRERKRKPRAKRHQPKSSSSPTPEISLFGWKPDFDLEPIKFTEEQEREFAEMMRKLDEWKPDFDFESIKFTQEQEREFADMMRKAQRELEELLANPLKIESPNFAELEESFAVPVKRTSRPSRKKRERATKN
jgi:site-specific DNA-adenine methylase